MSRRPNDKLLPEEILKRIKLSVSNEIIEYSTHTLIRMDERNISRQEVKTVLAFGYLEPSNDKKDHGI